MEPPKDPRMKVYVFFFSFTVTESVQAAFSLFYFGGAAVELLHTEPGHPELKEMELRQKDSKQVL